MSSTRRIELRGTRIDESRRSTDQANSAWRHRVLRHEADYWQTALLRSTCSAWTIMHRAQHIRYVDADRQSALPNFSITHFKRCSAQHRASSAERRQHNRTSQQPSERLKFRVPPLPVQRRIAGILSAYDELIENSQRRIRILEAMARALYREWFVHFRFPGHEDHPRVASPLGEIPEGWEVKTVQHFDDVSTGTDGARQSQHDFDGGRYAFVPTSRHAHGNDVHRLGIAVNTHGTVVGIAS